MEGQVSKEEIVRKLDQLPPETLAQVEQFIDYLQYRVSTSHTAASDTLASSTSVHPAFGIWADRTDIAGTISYAEKLRRNIEERRDTQL